MNHPESFPGRVVLSRDLIRKWRDSSHRMSHIKWGGAAQGAMRPIQKVVVSATSAHRISESGVERK
jgi:hypothetical protein